MAEYDTQRLTRLAHLKALAERVKNTYATKEEVASAETQTHTHSNKETLDKITQEFTKELKETYDKAQANVIEKIKVNGSEITPIEKTIDIGVPVDHEIDEKIKQAIADSTHASFKVVGDEEELPNASEAENNILYLKKNESTGNYDIYVKVENEENLVWLDDVSADLREYTKTEELKRGLQEAFKAKLDANTLYAGSDSVGGSATSAKKLDSNTVGSLTHPVYFENGVPKETTYLLDIATDAEVFDMLGDVFGLLPEASIMNQDETINGLDKQVSELISPDTKIDEDGHVTGTLKHIDGWSQFSSSPDEQDGNFFPVRLDSIYDGETITVTKDNGTPKEAQDREWVLRVPQTSTQFKFEAGGSDDKKELFTLTFTDATLENGESE